jgi:hypothetical protein
MIQERETLHKLLYSNHSIQITLLRGFYSDGNFAVAGF